MVKNAAKKEACTKTRKQQKDGEERKLTRNPKTLLIKKSSRI